MAKFWRFANFLLAFGVLLGSTPARAIDTFDFGNIFPGSVPGVLELPFDVPLFAGTEFLHVFGFDIDGPGTPEVSISFSAEPLAGVPFAIPVAIILSQWNGMDYGVIAFDGPDQTVFFSTPVANGLDPGAFNGRRYLLSIAGTTPEEFTSGYSAVLTVTAVPEPASIAFLLAGAGAIGMALRRNRSLRSNHVRQA